MYNVWLTWTCGQWHLAGVWNAIPSCWNSQCSSLKVQLLGCDSHRSHPHTEGSPSWFWSHEQLQLITYWEFDAVALLYASCTISHTLLFPIPQRWTTLRYPEQAASHHRVTPTHFSRGTGRLKGESWQTTRCARRPQSLLNVPQCIRKLACHISSSNVSRMTCSPVTALQMLPNLSLHAEACHECSSKHCIVYQSPPLLNPSGAAEEFSEEFSTTTWQRKYLDSEMMYRHSAIRHTSVLKSCRYHSNPGDRSVQSGDAANLIWSVRTVHVRNQILETNQICPQSKQGLWNSKFSKIPNMSDFTFYWSSSPCQQPGPLPGWTCHCCVLIDLKQNSRHLNFSFKWKQKFQW